MLLLLFENMFSSSNLLKVNTWLAAIQLLDGSTKIIGIYLISLLTQAID